MSPDRKEPKSPGAERSAERVLAKYIAADTIRSRIPRKERRHAARQVLESLTGPASNHYIHFLEIMLKGKFKGIEGKYHPGTLIEELTKRLKSIH